MGVFNKLLERDIQQIDENARTLRSRYTPAETSVDAPLAPLPDASAINTDNSLLRGYKAGVEDIAGTGQALAAEANNLVSKEDKAIQHLNEARQFFASAASRRQGKSFSELDSFGDFRTLIGEQFGQMLPTIASAIAGGGIFGASASMTARKLGTAAAKRMAKVKTTAGTIVGSAMGQGGENFQNLAMGGPERTAIEQQLRQSRQELATSEGIKGGLVDINADGTIKIDFGNGVVQDMSLASLGAVDLNAARQLLKSGPVTVLNTGIEDFNGRKKVHLFGEDPDGLSLNERLLFEGAARTDPRDDGLEFNSLLQRKAGRYEVTPGRGLPYEAATTADGKALNLNEQAGLAAGGALVTGALERVPVVGAFRNFKLGAEANRFLRSGARALETAASETVTELAQTATQRTVQSYVNSDRQVFDEQGIEEFLTVALVSPVIGGGMGAVGGFVSKAPPKQLTVEQMQQIDQITENFKKMRKENGKDSFSDSIDDMDDPNDPENIYGYTPEGDMTVMQSAFDAAGIHETVQSDEALLQDVSAIIGEDAQGILEETQRNRAEGNTDLGVEADYYAQLMRQAAHYQENVMFDADLLDQFTLTNKARVKDQSTARYEADKDITSGEYVLAPVSDAIEQEAQALSPSNIAEYKDFYAKMLYKRVVEGTPQGRAEVLQRNVAHHTQNIADEFQQEREAATALKQNGLSDAQVYDALVQSRIEPDRRLLDYNTKNEGVVKDNRVISAKKRVKHENKRLQMSKAKKEQYIASVLNGDTPDLSNTAANPYIVNSLNGLRTKYERWLGENQQAAAESQPVPSFEEMGGTEGILNKVKIKRRAVEGPVGADNGITKIDPTELLRRPEKVEYGLLIPNTERNQTALTDSQGNTAALVVGDKIVNTQALTMAARRKMDVDGRTGSDNNLDRLYDAFTEGMGTLAIDHGIALPKKFPPNTILFKGKSGTVTLEDVQKRRNKDQIQFKALDENGNFVEDYSLIADEFVAGETRGATDSVTGAPLQDSVDLKTGLPYAEDMQPKYSQYEESENRVPERRRTAEGVATREKLLRQAELRKKAPGLLTKAEARLERLHTLQASGYDVDSKTIRDLKKQIKYLNDVQQEKFNERAYRYLTEENVALTEIERKDKSAPEVKDKGRYADLKAYKDVDPIAVAKDVAFLNELVGKFKLKQISLMSTEQYYSVLHLRSDYDSYLPLFKSGRVNGVKYTNKKGETFIWVNPNLSQEERLKVLAHETGHALFKQRWGEATRAQKAAIIASWKEEVETRYGKPEFAKLVTDQGKPRSPNEVRFEYGKVSYKLSLEEYIADQVSLWVNTSKEASTVRDRYFKSIADAIIKLWDSLKANFKITPNKQVQDWINSLWFSKLGDVAEKTIGENNEYVQEAMPKDKGSRKITEEVKDTLGKDTEGQENWWVFVTSMLHSGNPGEVARGFLTVYDKLLTKNERDIVLKATDGYYVRNQVNTKLANNAEALAMMENDPRVAAAYAFALYKMGHLDVGVSMKSVFTEVLHKTLKVFGIVTNAEQATGIFDFMLNAPMSVKEQRLFDPRVAMNLPSQLTDTTIQRAVATVRPTIEAAFEKLHWLALGAHANFSKNPYAQKILLTLRHDITRPQEGGNYTENRDSAYARFSTEIHEVFDTLSYDQDLMEELHTRMIEGTVAESKVPDVRKAGGMLNEVFDTMHAYARRKGLDIGYIENYYPLVFDTDVVSFNADRFTDMLIRYMPDTVADTPAAKQATAEGIFDAIVTNDGLADVEPLQAIDAPLMAALHKRNLKWLTDIPEARKELVEFQHDDMTRTLGVYMKQVVRRAEYTHQYGKKGEKLQLMLDEAKANGVTIKEIRQIEDIMSGVLGMRGADFATHHPKLNKFIGMMSVFQVLRTMSTAIFSNLADTAGLFVRGDAENALKAAYEGVADSFGKYKGHTRELAEDIGAVQRAVVSDILTEGFEGRSVSGRARRVSDWFFRANGMEAWTQISRTMGASLAERMLFKWSQDPVKYAADLKEMGLRSGDLIFNQEGVIQRLNTATQNRYMREIAKPETPRARRQELQLALEQAERVDLALNRFINTAMLRPDAISRPNWANSPQFHLFFQLKGFMYKFWDVYHTRVFHELLYNENLRPLTGMLTFVPMYMFGEMLRDLVQHLGTGDPNKKDWDFMDTLGYSTQHSGITGMGEFGLDIAGDLRRGNLPGESFSGPTTEWFLDGMRAVSGSRSMDNFLLHSLPGQNLFLPQYRALSGD